MTRKQVLTRQEKQKKLIKASLLNPLNLSVLIIGFVAGVFSKMLIPIGVMAYGILCYMDLSSDKFVKTVLHSDADMPPETALKTQTMRPLSDQQQAHSLETKELQTLRDNIFATKDRIWQLYEQSDEFTRSMMGDFAQIEGLVARSEQFLLKAQTIRNYLSSENIEKIRRDIRTLQQKVKTVHDAFSKRQYQQALDARLQQVKTLQDIQRIYERLVSQLTNISISLDSMHSRMMKLQTSEYSMNNADSEQVSVQLNAIWRDVDQLDTALDDNLGLSD